MGPASKCASSRKGVRRRQTGLSQSQVGGGVAASAIRKQMAQAGVPVLREFFGRAQVRRPSWERSNPPARWAVAGALPAQM